ncbi:MAG: phosphoribosylglycinamide formyltransferase-1 [Ilumatobacter sp.]|jgi:phosphoribosylglycinamide formyltransferase-1
MSDSPVREQRLVVMVSGNGSNLQAVLDACADGRINARVVAVVSNKADVFALQRAANAGVPAVHIGRHADEDRADYDARLTELVAGFDPDLIVLAGWLRILTLSFLGWFPGRVVNLHPAQPGELPGLRAIERAWEEAVNGLRSESGVMVHFVPDEGIDDGPLLATEAVPIDVSGTIEEFEANVHAVEHRLLVGVMADLCSRRFDDIKDLQRAATLEPATPHTTGTSQ